MGRLVPLLVLTAGLLGCAAAPPPSHVDGQWSSYPKSTPGSGCPDGPVLGNGAVGVAVSGANGSLVFHIDRNDAWVPATGDISACGYDIVTAGARTLGTVTLGFDGTPAGFSATQRLSNGTVETAQGTALGGTLRTASFVARGTDVVVTELWWVCAGSSACSGEALPVAVANGQAGAPSPCHSFGQGDLWSSRTLGRPYQNVNSTVGRRHVYKAAWATVIEQPPAPPPGPAPPPAPPLPPPPPAPCATFDGDCRACIAAHDNRTVWPGACLQLNGTLTDAGQQHSCVPSSWWAEFNRTFRHVHACSSCTADKTCKHIPGPGGTAIRLRPNGPRATVITAVLSNFDPDYLPDESQRRPDHYPDPEQPAQSLAAAAKQNLTKLRATTAQWWAVFWAKSSVSLPTAPAMEKQFYGSLYVLASSHRTDGSAFAVAPGIVWPTTNDSPAFRGAFTMNCE